MTFPVQPSGKITVAILAGGESREREISLRSAAQIQKVLSGSQKYQPYTIDVLKPRWECIAPLAAGETAPLPLDMNDLTLPPSLGGQPIEVAFLATHGTPGENGLLQGVLDHHGIPYTTGNTFTQAVSFHKSACKRQVQHLVNTLDSVDLRAGEPYNIQAIAARLGFPLFVKPNDNGSSIGVQKVHSAAELHDAIANAFSVSRDIMLEKACSGREITCAVALIGGEITPLPITEIIPPDEFFNLQNKYDDTTREVTPAPLDESLTRRVQLETAEVFKHLGCRGVARADYIVRDGEPYFLEINTIPGMTAASLVPKQAVAAGYTLLRFFEGLLDGALGR